MQIKYSLPIYRLDYTGDKLDITMLEFASHAVVLLCTEYSIPISESSTGITIHTLTPRTFLL